MGDPTITVKSPPELIDAAVRVVLSEIPNLHRYDKVGWGWSFSDRQCKGARFFVRRTKAGLSVTATIPKDKTNAG